MYGGHIEGCGPRYCPSIEDKVVKFSEKPSHQVFLEQEGWDTNSLYVQGTSTSLPAEVQLAFLHTIPGLEECVMLKAGYAVEYDSVPPTELTHALMTKRAARPVPGRPDQRHVGLRRGRRAGTDGRRERRPVRPGPPGLRPEALRRLHRRHD